MNNQTIISFFVSLLLCITTHSYADTNIYSWRVSDLARSPVEDIKLRNQQDRVIKTVSAKQMVYLYTAMGSISKASETNADFLVVDGTPANAFAGYTENGANFIAINFAMLDILNTNMDMIAALLGHELAHLKLNHGEISKKNLEQNRGKDFSAASTRYSRDNEREADYLGTIWAVESGYDPEGAVALQEALYAQSKKTATMSFNISHPSGIERITILKSLVRRLSN